MRQLRVIQGGKRTHSSASGTKLLRAYSISDLQRREIVYHGVRFNWYCLERDKPPFPYARLIADYETLEDHQRSFLERSVNRYFTEAEIEALRKYLFGKYGLQVFVDEVTLPLKGGGAFFEEGSSVIYDFLELSGKEGYPLPFQVWGYYTLTHCLSSPSLENGVRFLLRAFELLDLQPNLEKQELESVVKSLFNNEGLVVKNRKHETD